jgi:putative transposase
MGHKDSRIARTKPYTAPNRPPEHIVQALIELRSHHPTWGGGKLLSVIQRRHRGWELPARSTACEILKRHGVVRTTRRRRQIGHPGAPTTPIAAPNDCWCADFKGQFKTADGIYCYPLTVTDGHSRFLLACQALRSTTVEESRPVFTRIFKEYGLPNRIRTDNGVPFATNTLARLSQLSAWWVRLGVLPERIEPGKPQQNGDTSACIARSKRRLRDRRLTRVSHSNDGSITSDTNSISSGRTRHWICRRPDP